MSRSDRPPRCAHMRARRGPARQGLVRVGASSSREHGARVIRAAGVAVVDVMQRFLVVPAFCVALAAATRSFRASKIGGRARARQRAGAASAKRALAADVASASGASGVAAGDADFELTLRAPGAEAPPHRNARSSSSAPQKSRWIRLWRLWQKWRRTRRAVLRRLSAQTPRARPQLESAARDAADAKTSNDMGALTEAHPRRAARARAPRDPCQTDARRRLLARLSGEALLPLGDARSPRPSGSSCLSRRGDHRARASAPPLAAAAEILAHPGPSARPSGRRRSETASLHLVSLASSARVCAAHVYIHIDRFVDMYMLMIACMWENICMRGCLICPPPFGKAPLCYERSFLFFSSASSFSSSSSFRRIPIRGGKHRGRDR